VGTNNLGRIKKLYQATKIAMDRETWFEILVVAQGQEVP
jgi:predicted oxidoreductase